MINYFLRHKTKKITSYPPSINDIERSRKVLFAIFTRYGDTIIDLVIIQEFMKCYPNKEYLILCPRQMKPYVSELLPSIECLAFNKRNLFEMLKVDKLLKRRKYDIGFNPWSNGLDSDYFISYCDKYLFYKDFGKLENINHYQVVRQYLNLPEKDWVINEITLKESYQKILICPQSTDVDRSISINKLNELISDLEQRYQNSEITIAFIDKEYYREEYNNFIFSKTAQSSKKFIDLVKENELLICCDSAPLHIALAMNKDLIAIFRISIPDNVVKSESSLLVKLSD